MAIQNIFRGLGIALITPFTAQGEVDYNTLANLVEYQITNGADISNHSRSSMPYKRREK